MEEGMESVAQMCNFLLQLYCVQRGGGGGRGCESLKIEKWMMVSLDGIEPAASGLLIQHSTTGSPGHVMKKMSGQYLKDSKFVLIHIYQK